MVSTSKLDTASPSMPQVGMLATLRNRRALIAAVEPFGAGPEGQVHLVRLEYIDSDGPLKTA